MAKWNNVDKYKFATLACIPCVVGREVFISIFLLVWAWFLKKFRSIYFTSFQFIIEIILQRPPPYSYWQNHCTLYTTVRRCR